MLKHHKIQFTERKYEYNLFSKISLTTQSSLQYLELPLYIDGFHIGDSTT